MRSAFLPFTGDPFCLKYFLNFCEKVWQDEVDELLIILNASVSDEVLHYCREITYKYDKVYLYEVEGSMDHGPAIDFLLNRSPEGSVMLVEEDATIFKKGEVDKCFKYIESGEYDLVGSPRGSCSQEIWDAAKTKWGLSYEGYGDQGPNFWPNFLFCKKEDLLKTNRHFQGKSWYKGERIDELDYIVKDEICSSDTFVWASLQLRNMGLRIKTVPQYHGYPHDLTDYASKANLWDGKCGWFHIGSLSGWNNVLFNQSLPVMAGSVEEWERRTQIWLQFWEEAQTDLPKEMEEFSKQYKAGIDRLIKEYNLSLDVIRQRQKIYSELLQ